MRCQQPTVDGAVGSRQPSCPDTRGARRGRHVGELSRALVSRSIWRTSVRDFSLDVVLARPARTTSNSAMSRAEGVVGVARETRPGAGDLTRALDLSVGDVALLRGSRAQLAGDDTEVCR